MQLLECWVPCEQIRQASTDTKIQSIKAVIVKCSQVQCSPRTAKTVRVELNSQSSQKEKPIGWLRGGSEGEGVI